MDWKKLIAAAAPGLATALGGPLAGGVVSILADKVLGGSSGDAVADEAKLAGVLAGGMTPELRAKIADAEAAFRLEALKAGVREQEIAAEDRSSARKAAVKGGTARPLFWLSLVLLMLTLGSEVAVLFVGYPPTIPDIVVGRVLGLMDSVALMVLAFHYGSSAGSAAKTEILAKR